MSPHEEHPDVLRARAETYGRALGIAATYELKGADAGTVRMILGQQALEAWKTYYRRVAPLGTAEALDVEAAPLAPSTLPPSSAVPSGAEGLTASSTAAIPGQGSAAPVPLDKTGLAVRRGGRVALGSNPSLGEASNVIELRFAHEAGDICHVCHQTVSWVDHLPPVGIDHPVRCFAGQYSVKV